MSKFDPRFPILSSELATIVDVYSIKEGRKAKFENKISEDGGVGGASAGATAAGGIAVGGGEALGVGSIKRGIDSAKVSKSPIPGQKKKRPIREEKRMKFPYKRDMVAYEMNLREQELTTLEGCPREVKKNFYCDYNNLKSLVGGPEIVGGDFSCIGNPLETLVGGPRFVGGSFDCTNTYINNLEGAPQYVGGIFDCSARGIKTVDDLKGIPNGCSGYVIAGTGLTSLSGIDKIITEVGQTGTINFAYCKITSGILGLLRIKGLTNFRIDTLDKDIASMLIDLLNNFHYNPNQKVVIATREIYRIAKNKGKKDLIEYARL